MDRGKSPSPESASLESISREILDNCLHNIIHDIVAEVHREEKILRMQSAVVLAEETARAQMPEPTTAPPKGAPPPTPTVRIETVGAVYDNGKTYIKGNPLQTTSEVVCPQCRLPRLQYPITGKGSRDPDLTKEYCMNYPYVSKSGHDIYGNPFANEQAKTKKERELIKQQERAAKDNTPGSNDTGDGPEKDNYKLNMGSKPASYVPWHTCPNCKRSLLITRFAQHLEKCLGIAGRQSSRNAMAKLTGQNGTGTGNTPLASRTGTPQPGQSNGKQSPTKKGGDEEEEEEKETPVKKKKKSSYIKKADRQRAEAEAAAGVAAAESGTSTPKSTQPSHNLKLKLGGKRPPKDDKTSAPNSKRERGEDDDEAPKKKKQKLARSDSIRTEGDDDGASVDD